MRSSGEVIDAKPVERIFAPSTEAFRRCYLSPRRPVVVEGLITAWPALSRWSIEWFVRAFANGSVEVTRTEHGQLAQDRLRGLVSEVIAFDAFAAQLRAPGSGSPGYLMMPLAQAPRAVRDDVEAPRYCSAARWRRSKLWISAPGTISPLHRDAAHNLLAQVTGRKRVLLFSRADDAAVYPRPVRSSLPNFAEVDPEKPDLSRHPRFKGATPFVAELGPADVLFIPSGFWHHVRTLEESISVNFWWAEGRLLLLVLAADLYKRLRGFSR